MIVSPLDQSTNFILNLQYDEDASSRSSSYQAKGLELYEKLVQQLSNPQNEDYDHLAITVFSLLNELQTRNFLTDPQSLRTRAIQVIRGAQGSEIDEDLDDFLRHQGSTSSSL